MKKHFLVIVLPILVASVFVVYKIFPIGSPLAGIYLQLSEGEIESMAYRIALEQGINTEAFQPEARIERNTALVRQVQSEFGIERSITLLREKLPGYVWKVYWVPENLFDVSPEDRASQVDVQIPELRSQIWRIDTRGNLLEFELHERSPRDSVRIDESAAHETATEFIQTYSRFVSTSDTLAQTEIQLKDMNITRVETPLRTDYRFSWHGIDPIVSDTIDIRLTVSGTRVSNYTASYKVPTNYSSQNISTAAQVFSQITHLLIAILTIVLAFRRWRTYELSFGVALFVGLLTGILFGIYLYEILDPTMGWVIIFPLIFAPLFIGGSMVFVWAVGDSVGREVWSEKFVTLDLIRRKHFLHSRIGQAVMYGLAYGAGSVALGLMLRVLSGRFITMTDILQPVEFLQFITAPSTLGQIFTMTIWIGLYTVAAYYLLTVSLLRKHVESPWLLLPIPVLIIVFAYQSNIEPLWLGVVLAACPTFLLAYAFYKHDILTAIVANLSTLVLVITPGLFTLGQSTYQTSGIILILIFVLLIGFSIACLYTRDRITDFRRIAPTYAQGITERQRLKRELDIARDVQMGFLPAKTPQIYQLDIASRCEPALEVGGDYYDFIDLGNNRLGIVIGDVSGKGTQAAFYMTLTKGFLKALAHVSDSPAVVLTQMNRLFYDNVKRGVFISMMYGVFDTDAGELMLARAGHNPLVMHNSRDAELRTYQPKGLALGMEKGKVFEACIQEEKIPIARGDVMVFYTDGFTEAVNKRKEEFGEDRLHLAVNKYCGESADKILSNVFKEVNRFAGGVTQQDDMTMVVVKIDN